MKQQITFLYSESNQKLKGYTIIELTEEYFREKTVFDIGMTSIERIQIKNLEIVDKSLKNNDTRDNKYRILEEKYYKIIEKSLIFNLPSEIDKKTKIFIKIDFYPKNFETTNILKHTEIILSNNFFRQYHFPHISSNKIQDFDINFILPPNFTSICPGNMKSLNLKIKNCKKFLHNSFNIQNCISRQLCFVIGTFTRLEILPNVFIFLPTIIFTQKIYKKIKKSIEEIKFDIKQVLFFIEEYIESKIELPLNLVFVLNFPEIIEKNISGLKISILGISEIFLEKDLEQGYKFRTLLFEALVSQVFPNKVCFDSEKDIWLILALKNFIVSKLIMRFFGKAYFLNRKFKMREFLVLNDVTELALYDIERPYESSFEKFCKIKGEWVMHLLESESSEAFMKKLIIDVFKFNIESSTAEKKLFFSKKIIFLSTHNFIKIARNITGKDLKRFFLTFISKPGLVILQFIQTLDPKKNLVTLNLKQHATSILPSSNRKYFGALKFESVEQDIVYSHTFDLLQSSMSFIYHLRNSKRAKKEDDIFLNFLYLRMDPEIEILASIRMDCDKMCIKESIEDKGVGGELQSIKEVEKIFYEYEDLKKTLNKQKIEAKSEKSALIEEKMSNEDNKTEDSLENLEYKTFNPSNLLDSLEEKLYSQNVFYQTRSDILFLYSRFDVQRYFHYVINNFCLPRSTVFSLKDLSVEAQKFLNSFSKSLFFSGDFFSKADKKSNLKEGFHKLYATEKKMKTEEKLKSFIYLINSMLKSIIKTSDFSLASFSPYDYISNVLSASGLFSEYSEEIIEEVESLRKSDLIFSSPKNLLTKSCIDFFQFCMIKGEIEINLQLAIKLTEKGNNKLVRKSAIETIVLQYGLHLSNFNPDFIKRAYEDNDFDSLNENIKKKLDFFRFVLSKNDDSFLVFSLLNTFRRLYLQDLKDCFLLPLSLLKNAQISSVLNFLKKGLILSLTTENQKKPEKVQIAELYEFSSENELKIRLKIKKIDNFIVKIRNKNSKKNRKIGSSRSLDSSRSRPLKRVKYFSTSNFTVTKKKIDTNNSININRSRRGLKRRGIILKQIRQKNVLGVIFLFLKRMDKK